MLGGVGKSNAKVYVQKQTGVTFADVAGQDEAKESLQEVVDFLKNPDKYTKIGAKLPKTVKVYRKEVFDAIQDENKAALTQGNSNAITALSKMLHK